MRSTSAAVTLVVSLAAVAGPGVAATDVVDVARAAAQARRAGLRVLEGERLVLATDRPPRAGDGVDEFPDVFDQAFAAWCDHFGIARDALPGWKAFGCLVVDRETFRTAGLLPDSIPEFPNGFCDRNRLWLMDQSNPAYRRHLLLHEGAHAFTLTVRGLATPPWYTEGIAEYLATHRLEDGADGKPRLVATPLPDRRSDVGQLGRIEKIRGLRRANAMPGLVEVFATPPTDHRDIAAYASSWAAVACLARHPAHAAAFAACERGPLDATFTDRLAATPGWDAVRAARDFDAFTDEVDYGYDATRSAVDWAAGRKPAGRERLSIDAARGWQNTGLALDAGAGYTLTASGTVRIGELPATADAAAMPLESEADGISLRWYRGRPAGRLLAAQWVERPAEGGRPRFVVLGAGSKAEFAAATDGPLFLKVNESPGDLAGNQGAFSVLLAPAVTRRREP
ncbi:MAG: hypothetical protein ACKOZU_07005 [Planctomycetaceae bacterium]